MSTSQLITIKKHYKTFTAHFKSVLLATLSKCIFVQCRAILSPNSRQINTYLMQSPQLLAWGFIFYIIYLSAGNQVNTEYVVQS
jgi:hypothetical protein